MVNKPFEWHDRMPDHRNKPSLRPPLFIGDFSLDSQREFHHDKRNLKFLLSNFSDTQKVSFDLNRAIDKSRKKDYDGTKKEKLNNMLNWILLNKYKFYSPDNKDETFKSLSTDFVSFRGLLTELLCTPYEQREGWIIHATKFAGTIYLLAIETEQKKMERINQTDEHKKFSSWGYKFEQYMSGEDTDKGVDENEEYCCVVRSRLDQHSLVYGAEVDGANKKLYHHPHSSLSAFLELKTCKEIVTQKDKRNFERFRLKKWWAQCHLVGIPKLICGFRDQDGYVNSLKLFEVEDMPRISRLHWSENVMMNFLDDFFSWLKEIITEDDPFFVYELTRLPYQRRITCVSLGSQKGSGEHFIPEWYLQNLFPKTK